ncbi:MAG: substrate-binding domain-containing protein [Solirubrobacterales bacterium]|nr:substrate-binding domain-containing protein [Solirubrobacterales bacterium]
MKSLPRRTAALATAGALALVAPAGAQASSLITISGATASYPLVSLLAAKYSKLVHHRVRFRITQGGSQIGVNDVAAGRVSIGDVSRDPLSADPKGLDFYPIAKYAVCIVTNSANRLTNLTTAQAQAIFTGKTRSWAAVPGASGSSGTIDLISRTSTAGTLSNFQTLLLEGKKVSSVATQESSEGLLRQAVTSDPSSIGFLSNYQAGLGGVNVVDYNGVACTTANARSGAYAGVARFYEVTNGRATGAVASFIAWIDRSRAARRIISSQWIPIG